MDEIYTYARPGDHVDESKNARLLRFRLMLGETCQSIRKRTKDGQIKLKNFDSPIPTENKLELTHNAAVASGESKDDGRTGYNLKSLKIEPSPCQCSMTSIGQKEEIQKDVFQISKKVKNYAKRFSRGHWTFRGLGDEKKWYGTLSYTPEGKWDSIASQMVERFKETGHLVFKSISALTRGILKERTTEIPFTSMRIHRTQNTCFARFSQQISSVSTEQSQAGVKSSVKRF